MTNFQLAECWLLLTLTVFTCHFSESYRIISVDKSFWECLKKNDENFTKGNRLVSISTIKRCPTFSASLENLLDNQKQSQVRVVFDEDKITLFFKTGKVVLFKKGIGKKAKRAISARRFGLLGAAAKWVKSKVLPKKTTRQSNAVYSESEGQAVSSKIPSRMASLSSTLIDGIFQILETIRQPVTKMLRNTMKYMSNNDCFVITAKNFKNAMVSLSLEQCQICGLSIPNLGHINKIMGPDFWNISVTHDFKNVTVKLSKFHVQSQLLPPPYSNLDLNGMQFHFDNLEIQTILIVPFKYLIIPSRFRTAVTRLDNFKVNFLTPNPTLSQRMIAYSLEHSAPSIMSAMMGWMG